MKNFLLLLLASSLLCSCEQHPVVCGDPVSADCAIVLTDSNDSLLIGKYYALDSISLWSGAERLPLIVSFGEAHLYYYSYQVYHQHDLLLYLSKEDQDTINLFLHVNHSRCWDFNTLDSLWYNKKRILPLGYNVFRVVKQIPLDLK